MKPIRSGATAAAALEGYRSDLERRLHRELERRSGGAVAFEKAQFGYEFPARTATYLPDFILKTGWVLELKGYLDVDARQKYLLMLEQNPDLRKVFIMIFENPKAKLPGLKMRNHEWCDRKKIMTCSIPVPAYLFDEDDGMEERREIIRKAMVAGQLEF